MKSSPGPLIVERVLIFKTRETTCVYHYIISWEEDERGREGAFIY
jgi:hypothetical protein